MNTTLGSLVFRGRFLLRTFLFLVLPLGGRADLRLTFDVVVETDSPASEKPKREATRSTRKFPLTLVLGDDYHTSSGDETSSLVDFKEKKILHLNPREKTYQQSSLYTNIGFRDAELRNRLMLHKVLAAGAMKDNPFEPVLMEHLFSLRAPGSAPLANTGTADALAYVHGGKPLFSCEAAGTSLSDDETKQFIRCLRYQFAMHPDIFTPLEQRKIVPAKFELHHYNTMKHDHYRFVLVKTEAVPRAFDPAAAVAGMKPRASEVDPLCALANAISPEQFATKCAGLIPAATIEAKGGRYLDSLLLFVEYALSTPLQQMPKEFVSYREKIQADSDAKLFMTTVRPANKVEAQKAADLMNGLRKSAGKSHAVLKINEANHLTAAGKPDQAIRLFHEALQEKPTIVGAWKDLGDLYYLKYEAITAWQCWDTGRRLSPEHKMFKQVTEFEARLAKNHPEFF